jgi:hypothetical protein
VNRSGNRQPRRKIGCLPALITVVITGGILLGLGAAIAAVFAPNLLNEVFSQMTGVETVQSRPVEGDAANFDPIASFKSMQAFAGEGAQLVEFEAYFVRSDGTLDLTATYNPSPRVSAEFVMEVEPPADAPPVGAGGGGTWYREVEIEAYRPGQTRRVSSSSYSYSYTNEGMTRDIDTPRSFTPTVISPPVCPFEALWRAALAEGAPAEAVATIEYDEDGYDFYIRDVGVRLTFGPDCEPTDD